MSGAGPPPRTASQERRYWRLQQLMAYQLHQLRREATVRGATRLNREPLCDRLARAEDQLSDELIDRRCPTLTELGLNFGQLSISRQTSASAVQNSVGGAAASLTAAASSGPPGGKPTPALDAAAASAAAAPTAVADQSATPPLTQAEEAMRTAHADISARGLVCLDLDQTMMVVPEKPEAGDEATSLMIWHTAAGEPPVHVIFHVHQEGMVVLTRIEVIVHQQAPRNYFVLERDRDQLAEKRVLRWTENQQQYAAVMMVRAGARQFIRSLRRDFHVVFYTAATPGYARAVSNMLLGDDVGRGMMDRRLCYALEEPLPQIAADAGLNPGDFIKPLSFLFDAFPEVLHPGNTVLLDNLASNAIQYPRNFVQVPDFDVVPINYEQAEQEQPGWTAWMQEVLMRVMPGAAPNPPMPRLHVLLYSGFMDGEAEYSQLRDHIRTTMQACANEQRRFQVPPPPEHAWPPL